MSDAASADLPEPPVAPSGAPAPPPDLDLIEADLADVEVALERLDDGRYWRDESTGEPIDDALLEQRPTTRRNPR